MRSFVYNITMLQRNQKKKLDLNHLLAKYEGITSNANYPTYQQPHQDHHIEEEFYQQPAYSRTVQHQSPVSQERPLEHTRTSQNNFTMSRSEVEAFLLSLKDQLRGEERSVAQHVDSAIKTIHENFTRSHEKLRRELLQLLDRAFVENERIIKQELARQSKSEPPEFTNIHRKIATFNQDIDRMIATLRGAEYRKIIAEVVTRDFNNELTQLRAASSIAKSNFIQSLGEVEPDRSRIEAIKQNLQKLFFINKKNTGLTVNNPIKEESSGIFSLFKEKPEPPVGQSRTRKSFFNFGGD